ncbi:MAG TPA: SGNH/GDSL hydrolase family protein [Solirubrobacteraceae bacterium]|nr:SGNH/GDSL hydrolase family protein [Solirubrobacteraceae bacterium]
MDIRIPVLGRLAVAAATFVTLALCAGSNLADAQMASRPGTAASVHELAPGPAYSVFPGSGDAPVPGPVRAAFLGDSYTFGVGASERTNGYAYLVAQAEGWSADVVGLPGSGYVRVAEKDNKRISAGIAPVIAARPAVVIVECGHNDADLGIDLARVEPNALRDLRALRAGLPEATIVVVGPVWLSGHPDSRVLAVRRAVHAAQRQIPGSLWIDPIAERWFTGVFARHTGDDATMINYAVGHPNDVGYRHIARLLERDLRSLGVR